MILAPPVIIMSLQVPSPVEVSGSSDWMRVTNPFVLTSNDASLHALTTLATASFSPMLCRRWSGGHSTIGSDGDDWRSRARIRGGSRRVRYLTRAANAGESVTAGQRRVARRASRKATPSLTTRIAQRHKVVGVVGVCIDTRFPR